MRSIMHMALLLLFAVNGFAQNEQNSKVYPGATKAGAVELLSSRISSDGNTSAKIFTILSPVTVTCQLHVITAMLRNETLDVLLDNRSTGMPIKAVENGWQKIAAGNNGAMQQLLIPAGKHEISFIAKGNTIPMVDDIYFQSAPGKTDFDAKWESVKQMIDKAAALPYTPAEKDKTSGNTNNIVLPNPEGVYNHELDMNFAYTTFSVMYLTAGTTITFATSGSTVDPCIMLFDPAAIDTRSWSNDDDGPGYESLLTVTIPVSSYYSFVARPYPNSPSSGVTTITKNGVSWLTNTPIGGLVLGSAVRTGELNYFTCRHTGDTRIFTESFNSGPFNGYNDDYAPAGGDWSWGTASRIKKNFTSNVTTTFVCAYSVTSYGVCDVYEGNPNSDVMFAFPNLKADDAIKTAPNTGVYNCISWSGGVTSTWIWPPEWSSEYCCNPGNNIIDCFDNFYNNMPVSRYPGAWSYIRTGATIDNSVVDLWKNGANFTHGSVRKPGNNNPHGYDWESKPGGLTRTLHPRNALGGGSYGSVSNYYRFSGNYGSLTAGGKGYESDADAIKAGVAVVENAKLTSAANDKLNRFIGTVNKNTADQFNQLYETWKRTWAANAMYSDPEMYRRNKEFDALAAFCSSYYKTIYLVFDKYVNGDIFIGKILWDNTRKQYSKLLEEAKAEYAQDPFDEQGRFKIRGDHDNGVHYVEKILKAMDEPVEILTTAGDNIKFSVSPNPVRDVVTVKVMLTEKQNISVQLISLVSNKQVWIQTAKEFEPGEYRFTTNVATLGFTNGEMIAVKLTAGAQQKTIKAVVVR